MKGNELREFDLLTGVGLFSGCVVMWMKAFLNSACLSTLGRVLEGDGDAAPQDVMQDKRQKHAGSEEELLVTNMREWVRDALSFNKAEFPNPDPWELPGGPCFCFLPVPRRELGGTKNVDCLRGGGVHQGLG